MSELQIFYERITELYEKLKNLQATVANNEELFDIFLEQANVSEVYKLAPQNLTEMVDKMRSASNEQELIIIEEIKSLSQLEKNSVYAMMELVVKIGELENSSDLEKRKHWMKIVFQIKNEDV
jgi:hypothetical protein